MRLRHVGPGIGGLNYSPLLRNVRNPRRAASAQLDAGTASPEREAALRGTWNSLVAAARRIGRAFVQVRMEQAERLIELEARRLGGRDGTSFDPSAIGSRYY